MREFIGININGSSYYYTEYDAHCPEDVGDKIAELERCVNKA